MSKKKSVNNQVVEQIIEEEKNKEKEEEIKLTPEEQKLLKLLKYKIKDLEEFGKLARLIHWYHSNYSLGQIVDVKDSPFIRLFETNDDSFMIFDKPTITALAFNTKLKTKNVSVRFPLANLYPLAKYLSIL